MWNKNKMVLLKWSTCDKDDYLYWNYNIDNKLINTTFVKEKNIFYFKKDTKYINLLSQENINNKKCIQFGDDSLIQNTFYDLFKIKFKCSNINSKINKYKMWENKYGLKDFVFFRM